LTTSMMKGVSSQTAWEEMLQGDARDATGQLLPAIDLIEKLGAKMAHLNTTQRAAQMIHAGFQEDSVIALGPLLQNYTALKKLRDELENAGNASHKMAEMVRQGLLSQMKILFNSASTIASIFGDRIAPAFYLVTSAFTAMATAFAELNPAMQSLIVYSSLLVIGFRPVMGILMGIGTFILGTLLSPFRLVYSAIEGVFTVISSVISGFYTLGKVAYDTALWIWGSMKRVGDVLYKVGELLFALGEDFYNLSKAAGKFIGNLIFEMGTLVVFAFKNVATALISLAGIMLSFVAALPMLALFSAIFVGIGAVIMAVVVPALAAVAAIVASLVVTLTMALGQLLAVIGTALVAAWGAFQTAAVAAFSVVGGTLVSLGRNFNELWVGMQQGTEGFVRSVAESMKTIAGFFWHFKYNVGKIWEWLKESGEQPFIDIGNAAFAVFNTLANNLFQIFKAIGMTIWMTLSTAFQAVWGYLRTFFAWFAGQFPNMVMDMSTILAGFLSGLKQNFVQLFGFFSKLLDEMGAYLYAKVFGRSNQNEIEALDNYYERTHRKALAAKEKSLGRELPDERIALGVDFGKDLDKLQRGVLQLSDRDLEEGPRAAMMKRIEKSFNNTTEGFKPMGVDTTGMKFMTDTASLKEGMGRRSGVIGESFTLLGNVIPQVFKDSFKEMIPFSKAFEQIKDSPMWQALFSVLNTNMATKDWVEMESFVKRLTGLGEQEAMGMAGGGKPSVGFSFKQISEARTMTSGAAYENLEYQQLRVLQSMDKKLGTIADANGMPIKNQPAPPPVLRD
jgi:hypothetical protein